MPFDYEKDDERRRIRLTLQDPLSVQDLIASVERQFEDDAWTYGVLVDARQIQSATTPAEIAAFRAHVEKMAAVHGPRGPVAIVARAAGAIAGGQMYRSVGDRTTDVGMVEVFWDAHQAERWLDAHVISR
jgi:hypothetical protein